MPMYMHLCTYAHVPMQVIRMSSKTLESVWYFAGFDRAILVELALKVHRAAYAPQERVRMPIGIHAYIADMPIGVHAYRCAFL